MNKIIPVFLTIALFTSCMNNKETVGYAGKDISEKARIIRDKHTKATSLQIETNDKWKLYAGNTVENINFSVPVAEGTGSGTFKINVPDSVRSYFELVTPEGKAILAEKHLPMSGGYNFRDLGGTKTTDGKYVKWGKIFRSDDLYNLTDSDLQYLSSIPVVTIVDFRSQQEIDAAPDKNPRSLKNNFPYSITPGNLMGAATMSLDSLTESLVDSMMMEVNILIVTDSAAIEQYRNFFALLQKGEVPLMFHCSAGKDRTGMGAALVLYALGVDEQTIIDNYLLSNTYLDTKYAQFKTQYPSLKSLYEVKATFLNAGLDRVKKDHGSVENYLKNVLNVDIDKMKTMYLD